MLQDAIPKIIRFELFEMAELHLEEHLMDKLTSPEVDVAALLQEDAAVAQRRNTLRQVCPPLVLYG